MAYKIMREKKFKNIYKKLVTEICVKYFNIEEIYVQPRPAFRIHPLNEKTVPFHIDKWSGHPSEITNVWIPLTKMGKSSCLQIVPSSESTQLINKLERGDISLELLNKNCEEICEPIQVPIGKALFFSNFIRDLLCPKDLSVVSP